VLTDDLLSKLVDVFRGLRVDEAAMARHLADSGGAAMTENLMLTLTARGVPRSDAHELLRRLTRDLGAGTDLADRAANDPVVRKWLRPEEIRDLLDPARYVQSAAAKADRVIAKLADELGP
jgi:adenylosuccinate lyase